MKNIATAPPCVAILSICLAAFTSLAGCSGGSSIGKTIPVSGKVTYKGQPVGGASVTFIGDKGARTTAVMTAPDGTYNLTTLDAKGAVPGNYKVVVDKTDMPAGLTKSQSMEEAEKNAPTAEPKKLLPEKYSDPKNTPLQFEVKDGGAATFDIELKDD